MRLGIGKIKLGNNGPLKEIQSVAEVSCLPAEIILLRPLRSLHPSAARITDVSVWFSALTCTGLPSIHAKFEALGALDGRKPVAEI